MLEVGWSPWWVVAADRPLRKSAGGLVRRIDAIGGREARWCGGASGVLKEEGLNVARRPHWTMAVTGWSPMARELRGEAGVMRQ